MGMVIFVGGSTASGKSTFADKLSDNIENSKKYRRYQGFFDIAMQRGIPKDEIFKKVSSADVDDWFVNICKEFDCIISDVHYAIQMDRKSDESSENIDIYQEYVPTISKGLLEKLLSSGIKIVAIHISCSPETCLRRAISRYNNQERELRNKSLKDAELENIAEKREWKNILSLNCVHGIELNSELYSSSELVEQCLEYFYNNNSYSILKKTKLKKTKKYSIENKKQ